MSFLALPNCFGENQSQKGCWHIPRCGGMDTFLSVFRSVREGYFLLFIISHLWNLSRNFWRTLFKCFLILYVDKADRDYKIAVIKAKFWGENNFYRSDIWVKEEQVFCQDLFSLSYIKPLYRWFFVEVWFVARDSALIQRIAEMKSIYIGVCERIILLFCKINVRQVIPIRVLRFNKAIFFRPCPVF